MVAEVGGDAPRNDGAAVAYEPPAHERGGDRQATPRLRCGDGRVVVRNRDQVHDARQDSRVEPPARSFRDDQVDHGRPVVMERRQRAYAQRVPVLALHALREVHVAPALRDVAEQGVLPHPLAVLDPRNDVPIAVRAAAAGDDPDVLATLAVDLAACDGVDGRPVRSGDVDAEVEGLAALRADPRIAEEPTHRVLLVERLDGPAVAHLRRAGSESRSRCPCARGCRPRPRL